MLGMKCGWVIMLGNHTRDGQRYNVLKQLGNAPETYFHVRRSVAAIKSIWQKLASANNTKIEIAVDKDVPEILPIKTLKVQHCLNNLVENAVQNTKYGTVRIVVSTIRTPNDKPYTALSVQDSGPGLTSSQIETIFVRDAEVSHRREPEYGVVDTGLPMTHDLITELGGKIFVQSTPDRGSVFSLLLPIEPSLMSGTPIDIDSNVHKSSPCSDLNILVVDDYNLNQLTIKTLLHDHLGKIYSAIHGYEALEIMHSCPVDVILMDINMPVMDGCEATLKIRASNQPWAGVHIFAMTADPQYHHTQLYRKIGMDGTLPKPFRKDDILRVLENCAGPYKRAACE